MINYKTDSDELGIYFDKIFQMGWSKNWVSIKINKVVFTIHRQEMEWYRYGLKIEYIKIEDQGRSYIEYICGFPLWF